MSKNDDLTQIQRDSQEGGLGGLASAQGAQDTNLQGQTLEQGKGQVWQRQNMEQAQALNAQNPLKSQVLELFQDSEVQEAMFQWLLNLLKRRDTTLLTQVERAEQEARQQYNEAKAQIQEQQTALAQLKQELLALQQIERENQAKLAKAQAELNQSQSVLESTQKELENTKADLKRHQVQAYELFLTLPPSLKQGLSNLFSENDPLAFLAIGTQGKNIEMLWDYTHNALKENKEGAQILVEIFYALFGYYAKATPYKLDPLEVGQPYNPTKHQRHHSSLNASGNITQVLLRGYLHTKSGEIKRQSVIKL
ncbi:hypothetical protein NHP190012_07950 [Helicobacter sp. NHP19-012]|uniref:Uncharacterized protein n=1 Tax=Helicobacter gastrofelis TaxID=2849642 RepID=A0ABM7SEG6_9HELI|nr:hypothetical protein [Helicobacter sp. NHP19-012]BCZ19153.1 hypothetical protein NHP190012_07950 [Helicobacter sp. NHP19-012]